jgi:type VI secretion system protein ImpF
MQGTILDRLIDQDLGAVGPVQYRQLSFNQAKAAVGRDLENLLNTKNFEGALPEVFKELNRSALVYGLPDFTATNPHSSEVKSELLQAVERAINLFEPRLQNVMVSIDDSEKNARSLKFRISAILVVDPYEESVRFDTFFNVNKCEYSIAK